MGEKMINVPELNSLWRHRESKQLYQVYDITNMTTEKTDRYPIRVSYKRLSDGTKWSDQLQDWIPRFIPEN